LECALNKLKEIDVSGNRNIRNVFCGNNRMDAESLNNLFISLPEYDNKELNSIKETSSTIENIISYSGNPGARECNMQIFENKGWKMVDKITNW